jgi:hypothetical protein
VTVTRGGTGSTALQVNHALASLAAFRAGFTIVEESDAAVARLAGLVQQIAVAGKQIHDANIVATMQVHGIARLLTNNEAHFMRFSHLITVVPLRSFR